MENDITEGWGMREGEREGERERGERFTEGEQVKMDCSIHGYYRRFTYDGWRSLQGAPGRALSGDPEGRVEPKAGGACGRQGYAHPCHFLFL